mmetsp:Transcript_15353/g.26876  ORF Transcript_15353/g.26876 Transcript_15353/m.26876 type:complete len:203 (-) Transcript_15353:462-1070(-)
MPPSLAPESRYFSLGSRLQMMMFSMTLPGSIPQSSRQVSFGSISAHQRSCMADAGAEAEVSSLFLIIATFSLGGTTIRATDRPRMERTVTLNAPSGTESPKPAVPVVDASAESRLGEAVEEGNDRAELVGAVETELLDTLGAGAEATGDERSASTGSGDAFSSKAAASRNREAMKLYGSSGRSRRSSSKRACMNSCKRCLSK